MVTVPSGAMRTHAFMGFEVDCASAFSISITKPNARPPETFRKSRRSMSRLLRGLLDGRDDAVVGAAAAEVAVHVADDLVPAGVLVGGQELRRLHDLARLAIAALRHGLLDPGLLQGVGGCGGEALDGGDTLAFGGRDRCDAGAYRDAVEVDGAGAAERGAAAVLRPGELELVAQHPEQRGGRLGLYGDLLAIQD